MGEGTSVYWDFAAFEDRKTILKEMGYPKDKVKSYSRTRYRNLPIITQNKISDYTEDARWFEYNTKTGEKRATTKRL